ncbi:MAG TPA: DUF2652 domain-containing protein [Anaerolineales bacterium]|jgi:hypothetical protein
MADAGILLLSDITGYSSYVNQSELDHARSSLTDLLNLLIAYTRSPLVLSKLEGDAVLSYAPYEGFLQGTALVEMIESTYIAFRKALDLMILNTTCTCAACRNLKNLDLKFFIHCGSYTIQSVGQFRELLGHDVNLLHRLAKNHIREQTGLVAYAAYSQAVIDRMGLSGLTAGMRAHREAFADVGEVQLFVQDMHGVWEQRSRELRIRVEPDKALARFEQRLSFPIALVWQYATDPRYRAFLFASDFQELKDLSSGRAGEGAAYVCAHGEKRIHQSILDWQPLEEYTTVEAVTGGELLFTIRLSAAGQETNFEMLAGAVKAAGLSSLFMKAMLQLFFFSRMPARLEQINQQIRRDLAEGTTVISSEPPVDSAAVTQAVLADSTVRD